jgi:ribulose kinase
MVGNKVVQRVRFLVGSGNGMRRNSLLRKITSQTFQKELSVPCHEEEAAVGAAINGAVAAGVFKDFQEAAPLIRY